MKKKELFFITSLLAIIFSSVIQAEAQINNEKPNVLMLCVDDMNDWVGYLGGHPQTKTPNIDELAARGLHFTRSYCPAPGCSPSRNAILFGVEPFNSGLYPFYNINNIEPGILDPYTSLPLHFRLNGYKTCGLKKVFHNPDNSYLQDSTWDEYVSYGDRNIQLIKEKGYVPDKKRLISCPASNSAEDFQDRRSARHAAEFLTKEHEKPFFLAVGFIKPHTPFIVPEEYFNRFSDPVIPPKIKADDLMDIPIAGRSNAQIYVEIPMRKDHAWEQLRRGYLACISFTDDNVGIVLDALENSKYADNTIIVLWSDHGFHLGEKRTFSKFSLWEEATRSPFIIYDPRYPDSHGEACTETVGLINIYQTLCDLTSIEAPAYVDGMSLEPWLQDPSKPKENPAITTWGRGNYTIRTKEWRYTRYFDGSEELYNEICDPHEWKNLANNPDLKYFMKEMADKWLPKEEAPQVTSGRELYNVADSDNPTKNINYYKRNVQEYKELNLQPPLD